MIWDFNEELKHDDDAIMQVDGVVAEVNYNFMHGILGQTIQEINFKNAERNKKKNKDHKELKTFNKTDIFEFTFLKKIGKG